MKRVVEPLQYRETFHRKILSRKKPETFRYFFRQILPKKVHKVSDRFFLKYPKKLNHPAIVPGLQGPKKTLPDPDPPYSERGLFPPNSPYLGFPEPSA